MNNIQSTDELRRKQRNIVLVCLALLGLYLTGCASQPAATDAGYVEAGPSAKAAKKGNKLGVAKDL